MKSKKDLILRGNNILKSVKEYFYYIEENTEKYNIDKKFKHYIHEYYTDVEENFEFFYKIINDNEHQMSDDELEEWLKSNWDLLTPLP